MTGAKWYISSEIFINRSKNIKGRGQATPRYVTTLPEYDSSVIFTDVNIDILHIRESGVNITGLVIDVSRVPDPYEVSCITYWYKDVLIQEGNLDVSFIGTQSTLNISNEHGYIGLTFDSERENELIPENLKDTGEIHFLKFRLKGLFLNKIYYASNLARYSKLEQTATTSLTGAAETSITLDDVPSWIYDGDLTSKSTRIAIQADNGRWIEINPTFRTGNVWTFPATDFSIKNATLPKVRIRQYESNNTHNVYIYNGGSRRAVHLQGSSGTSVFDTDCQSYPSYTTNETSLGHHYLGTRNNKISGYAHDVDKSDSENFDKDMTLADAVVGATGTVTSFTLNSVPDHLPFDDDEYDMVIVTDAGAHVTITCTGRVGTLFSCKPIDYDFSTDNASIGNNVGLKIRTHKYFLQNYDDLNVIDPVAYQRHFLNGQIREIKTLANTALMRNSNGLVALDNANTNSNTQYIDKIDNILSNIIARGATVEVNWYENDGTFDFEKDENFAPANELVGAGCTLNQSLGSYTGDLNHIFTNSFYQQKPVFTPTDLDSFNSGDHFFEINISGLGNANLTDADMRLVVAQFYDSYTPRELTIMLHGTNNYARRFTEGESWSKDILRTLYSGGNNCFRASIRCMGFANDSIILNRIGAKSKYPSTNNLPMISTEGGQRITGSLELTELKCPSAPVEDIIIDINYNDAVNKLNEGIFQKHVLLGTYPPSYNLVGKYGVGLLFDNGPELDGGWEFFGTGGDFSAVEDPDYPDKYYMKYVTNDIDSTTQGAVRMTRFTVGNTYQWSFECRKGTPTSVPYLRLDNGGTQNYTMTEEWTKNVWTFTANGSKPDFRFYSSVNNLAIGSELHLRNFSIVEIDNAVPKTGIELRLDDKTTRYYNMGVAEAGEVYTTVAVREGGRAVSLINTTVNAPVVSGGTYRTSKGDPWVSGTDMYLEVRSLDGVNVEYWFELAI